MMRSALIVIGVGLGLGCKTKQTPPPPQSFVAALRILCGGEQPPDWSALPPAERHQEVGRWLDQRVTSPEARALLAALADSGDRPGRVRAAATAAGLASCTPPAALFGTTSIVGGASVPELPDATGTDELDQDAPIVVVTPTSVIVDGQPIAAAKEGALEAADAERVATFLAATGKDLARVALAVDRTLDVEAVRPVLDAIARSGAVRLDLVVAAGIDGARMIPLGLPDPTSVLLGGMSATITHGRVDRQGAPRNAGDHTIAVVLVGPLVFAELAARLVALRDEGPRADLELASADRVGDMAGAAATDDDDDVSRRRPGADLDAQIAAARQASADATLARVHATFMAGLRRCYNQALTRDGPDVAGSFILVFSVGADGRVTRASVSGDPGSPELRACFISQMRKWRFEPPTDVGEYRIPLSLKTE